MGSGLWSASCPGGFPGFSCFLTVCLTLLKPCFEMTQASLAAFKFEAEFRAGWGSGLGEGTSLADQMSLRLAKNVSPAGPNRCISAAKVWPLPLLRQDPTLTSRRRERRGGRGRFSARRASRGPPSQSSCHGSGQPRSTPSGPGAGALGPGGRTGYPPSIRSPSSRWQDLWPGSFQSHQGPSTLFKNFNQQLPARRTARLGPAGWKPMTVHPQRA